MAFPGCATPEGTARYAARLQGTVAQEHFREFQGLKISSIGLGTYLGEHDGGTDAQYRDAIMRAVELGCNLIDTAVNYRFQQSERTIGQALATLIEKDECNAMNWSSPPRAASSRLTGSPPRRSKNFSATSSRPLFNPESSSQPISSLGVIV